MKLSKKIIQKPDFLVGIDPGNEETAIGMLDLNNNKPIRFTKVGNRHIRSYLLSTTYNPNKSYYIAMEEIVNYGGSVGRTVFETVEWIGRLKEFMEINNIDYETIKRKTVISELTGNPKGNDSHVREEMIYLYGKPGTKKKPGPTYGITTDMWSALGIATAVAARKKWITI